MKAKNMLTLGIESSCDETAVAVVENGKKVLSSVVASQIKTHAAFGGVVPEIAAREHLKNIYPVFQIALKDAAITPDQIDLISVTQGPGLIGALLIGVSFAKSLALSLNKPLQPVDHVHAHVHGALLDLDKEVQFPSLALVVSGGHTNLYHMKSPTEYTLLASTIDDACGESFDKVAKLMDLGYPGGPKIEEWAKKGDKSRFKMPKMVNDRSKFYFSYSGLKTHVYYAIRKLDTLNNSTKADLCAAFQEEAFGQICRKLKQAHLNFGQDTKSVIIAGGVAANTRFKEILANNVPLPAIFPNLKYCSDNAAMIAAYGYQLFQKNPPSIKTQPNWDAYSRYDFEAVTKNEKS